MDLFCCRAVIQCSAFYTRLGILDQLLNQDLLVSGDRVGQLVKPFMVETNRDYRLYSIGGN